VLLVSAPVDVRALVRLVDRIRPDTVWIHAGDRADSPNALRPLSEPDRTIVVIEDDAAGAELSPRPPAAAG
jgi:hypothetical protein